MKASAFSAATLRGVSGSAASRSCASFRLSMYFFVGRFGVPSSFHRSGSRICIGFLSYMAGTDALRPAELALCGALHSYQAVLGLAVVVQYSCVVSIVDAIGARLGHLAVEAGRGQVLVNHHVTTSEMVRSWTVKYPPYPLELLAGCADCLNS